ncbi:Acyltransferase family protein [Stieleria bergensis]|uniref:Acyltransferase family protein n=1 Tax=Stieleria bergensis TaxID=2528025 RepID=A0A517SSV6_9BACT|nr:Acyltransferase family protein [Planctomycetes bacterium SV_7m_r]
MEASQTQPSDSASAVPAASKSKRIAALDWARGIAMIFMMLDHVSMAFDANHFSADSAAAWNSGTTLVPSVFLTRWISHVCAPIFVLLAGTALALSIERRVEKGADAKSIDSGLLKRGLFIAILDPTVLSFFSGGWRIQVLYAIGAAMMCMAVLRRLPSSILLALALGWFGFGEALTGFVWQPDGETGPQALVWGLLVGNYQSPDLIVRYPLIPWLAYMILGWVLGRWIIQFNAGKTRLDVTVLLMLWGALGIATFVAVRYFNGYGNVWLYRESNDLVQWLHVSKYPPSLSYTSLELGLTAWLIAALVLVERKTGVRPNGPLLVFGQTAMFFYLLHRVTLEGLATYAGLRGCVEQLWLIYLITAGCLFLLYPICRWYRTCKSQHRDQWWTTYI